MRIEKTIFICYRRTNIPWALAIFKDLTAHGYDVFFDFLGIASGDFERVIRANIRARAHFLVLLTPSALDDVSRPDDWLRREIEIALDAKRNIVPLMLEGFDFDSRGIAKRLTGRVADLKSYNALPVPAAYFDEAMSRLRNTFLNIQLDAVLHPESPAEQQTVQQQQAAAGAPTVQKLELTAQECFEQAYKAGDPAEAIRLYSQAIAFKPEYAFAFNNRGLLREQQGDLAGAREDYDTAIRLKPDYTDAFKTRGAFRWTQGDLAGARADYDIAIRLTPDDDDALYNRGLLRRTQGDVAGALEDYNTAIRLRPDAADTFVNRGVLLEHQGDLVGARDDFDTAISLKPDYALAFDNRGAVREKLGDSLGAQQDFDTAKRLRSGR
jgi:tetratricopeptide (TPR) repeat protein